MDYEYEMFFDDNSPISIHGWWPIATDRIKDQSRIQEYIDKGILRRIDMKEQDAAHSFEARLEFLREYAKCGINHNYSHSDSLKHKLQTLDDTVSELTRLRSELQQKNEVIRELIPLAVKSRISVDTPDWEMKQEDKEAVIKRARKLIKL